MSDWGAVADPSYFNAGLDQESGSQLDAQVWFDAPLQAEYAAGTVSAGRLSDAVRRIVRSIYAVGADRSPTKAPIDYAAHAAIAREAAAGGIVLLKNDGALPLDASGQSIVVIGGHADIGVLSGGGSSQVTPPGGPAAIIPVGGPGRMGPLARELIMPSSPLRALRNALPGRRVQFDSGYDVAAAVALAARADVAIVFASRWNTEGVDSGSLSLPLGQDDLIAQVSRVNAHTIVVLETGNPVRMPWLDNVRAVVEAWYPGQEGGAAIADVLTGKVNPSGRLPITFPVAESQYPRPDIVGLGAPDTTPIVVDYAEGAQVGYRWYASQGLKPLFAFGHGLSYTSFAYDDVRLRNANAPVISFLVRNTGARDGATTPQVYLIDRAGHPVQRLVGFKKVALAAGGSVRIDIPIDVRLLARWDTPAHAWRIDAGTYAVALADAADDLRVTRTIVLPGRRLAP